jgi:MerR family transcriptional regulator, thiopeptide resistance regulator
MYTVKQISTMAGLTPRTLHYYDEIGLLKPTRLGENGYRYYDQEALLRLQQILLYRELNMPLENIRKVLNQPDFEVKSALERHKQAIQRQMINLERLLTTIDNTILHLEGKTEMSSEQMFDGFSDEQQAEYEKEAMQMYDPAIVKVSNQKWKSYTNEEKKRILEEGKTVYENFVKAMPKGSSSPEAQACVEHWRRHIEYFWLPDDEQLIGLTEGYSSDRRFKDNFDKIHPDLAKFVGEAVKVYVAKKAQQ